MVKNSTWHFNRCGPGFEYGTIEKKISKRLGRDLNSILSDYMASALTKRTRCLPHIYEPVGPQHFKSIKN